MGKGGAIFVELLLPLSYHARCWSFGLIPPISTEETKKLMSVDREAFHENPQLASRSRFIPGSIRRAHFTDPPELPTCLHAAMNISAP